MPPQLGGSSRVIGGLRQLVASTRAIESGADSVPVVIRSRDEVGELALAFNRMVEELRTRERIKETFGKFLDPLAYKLIVTSVLDYLTAMDRCPPWLVVALLARELTITGLRSIATPIQNAAGFVSAGVSLNGPVTEAAWNQPELVELVKSAAREICAARVF